MWHHIIGVWKVNFQTKCVYYTLKCVDSFYTFLYLVDTKLSSLGSAETHLKFREPICISCQIQGASDVLSIFLIPFSPPLTLMNLLKPQSKQCLKLAPKLLQILRGFRVYSFSSSPIPNRIGARTLSSNHRSGVIACLRANRARI